LPNVNDLPTVFERNMKVSDEMYIVGEHVRIEKIELVIHLKNIDRIKPMISKMAVRIPMTNLESPIPIR
jgi:hypothetical protein